MSEKMKNLAVRALSGAVLAVVTVGAILLSKWTYGALLLAILAGGMYETYRLAACNGARPQYGMGLAAGVALFAVNFFAGTGLLETTDLPRLLTLYFLVMLPAVFICELFRRLERPETNVGATLLGVGYVALPLSLMCYIPAVGGVWQPWTMIAFVFIIWANDVCAYLIGMTLGRHPLCERISPKKTWEGFLGGSREPWARDLPRPVSSMPIRGIGRAWRSWRLSRACWAIWWSRCSSVRPVSRIRAVRSRDTAACSTASTLCCLPLPSCSYIWCSCG